nr:MAG TPA: hypothetical protein [Caudoviricetes sp.]
MQFNGPRWPAQANAPVFCCEFQQHVGRIHTGAHLHAGLGPGQIHRARRFAACAAFPDAALVQGCALVNLQSPGNGGMRHGPAVWPPA